MNCYVFELKSKLSETEILECFEFMKSYLISIYGEEAISEQNFLVWKSNIEKINKNRYFIKISKEKETCGYAQISITENNTLYFGDIIIKESMRRTRVVYEFVKYVLNLEEFKHFEEIYLLINKNNKTSFNTWKRLGLQEIESGKISNKYILCRKEVENYINRFSK